MKDKEFRIALQYLENKTKEHHRVLLLMDAEEQIKDPNSKLEDLELHDYVEHIGGQNSRILHKEAHFAVVATISSWTHEYKIEWFLVSKLHIEFVRDLLIRINRIEYSENDCRKIEHLLLSQDNAQTAKKARARMNHQLVLEGAKRYIKKFYHEIHNFRHTYNIDKLKEEMTKAKMIEEL